jgi:hypothetical protein
LNTGFSGVKYQLFMDEAVANLPAYPIIKQIAMLMAIFMHE